MSDFEAKNAHQDTLALAVVPFLRFGFESVCERESLSLGRVEPKRGFLNDGSVKGPSPAAIASDPPACGRVMKAATYDDFQPAPLLEGGRR